MAKEIGGKEKELKVGQRVVVAQRVGTVRFRGPTQFAAGHWIGVELDEAVGKNNGKVQGIEYFSCPPEHGIFVRANLVLTLEEAEATGGLSSRKSVAKPRPSIAVAKAASSGAQAAGRPLEDDSPAIKIRPSIGLNQQDDSPAIKVRPPQAPGESPKQALENKTKKIRQQVEEAKQDLEKERKQLQDAEKRLGAAQAAAEASAGTADSDTSKAAEELREARAAKAKVIDDVDRRRSQVGALEEANAKLKQDFHAARDKALTRSTDEVKELTRQLAKLELSRELEEHRAAELSLDLEELRLRREEERVASRSLLNGKGQQSPFTANSDEVAEYQSALHVLQKCCAKDKSDLLQRAEQLEKASTALHGLKRSEQALTAKREELTSDILDMDRQVAELSHLMKVGNQLQDEQMSMATELRRQLDSCDGRVNALEGLVKKLHRERLEVESAITKDSTSAGELSQQVQQLASEQAKARGEAGYQVADHARVVAAAVRRRLAALCASAAEARASAFTSCMPQGWVEQKPILGKVAQSADVISAVEACLCRAEALTTHICTRLLASLPPGSDTVARWLCALCLVSGSCAAAAATALDSLRASAPEELELKKGPFEVTITEREGNLGLSVKGVPPAKTLPVQKIASGSLAEKHGVRVGQILIAVQRKPTEHMTLDVFKTVMKQRPLILLLRHPPTSNTGKASDIKLDIDMNVCNTARTSLDELLTACRSGRPEPKPEALPALSALEEQFLALQNAAPGQPPNAASRCATALALRRIEAVYRFGINVGPAVAAADALAAADKEAELAGGDEVAMQRAVEKRVAAQQVQVREDLAKRLAETATRLQMAEAGREFSLSAGQLHTLDEARQLQLTVLQALLKDLQSLEASLRAGGEGILAELDRAATSVYAHLDEVTKAWPVKRSNNKGQVTTYSATGAPGWTSCATSVQSEIEAVFEAQRTVTDGRASLVVKKTAAEESEQRLKRATERRTELQQEVDKLREKCEQCSALDAEAEALYSQAKKDTSAQAELELKLDNARTSREEQERAARDGTAKLSETERMLEERRRRPREELEGRATAQELATLKHTSVKGAREFYAMQVDAVKNLEPLPSFGPVHTATTRALESCVARYAELRRELLTDWTRARLEPLAKFPAKKRGMLEASEKQKLGRIQHLQLQMAELRSQVSSLAAPLPGEQEDAEKAPRQSAIAEKKNPPVQVKLEFPCPKWVTLAPKMDAPLAVTLEELQGIHQAVVS